MRCLFASDLHGRIERYRKLLETIAGERPHAVFLGGDLLPIGFGHGWAGGEDSDDFVLDYLTPRFRALAGQLKTEYPRVLLILGNDDPRVEEAALLDERARDLWRYVHNARFDLDGYPVYGYAYVPPTPFSLKDWERYDVSRHLDPGCISPEEGRRSIRVEPNEIRYATIQQDLDALVGDDDMSRAVFLFHSPPYRTALDRAALDGKKVDHAPLDVNIGSIAIRRFLERRQPLLSLHGHVHESARLTGNWRDRIGRTHLFSAAHDGPELALVRFDLEDLDAATRELA